MKTSPVESWIFGCLFARDKERHGERKSVNVYVRVGAAYISELPYDTGRLGVPIAGAVLHPDGSLAVNHLSTQLRH